LQGEKIYNQYLTNICIRSLQSIIFDIRLFDQNQFVNQREHKTASITKNVPSHSARTSQITQPITITKPNHDYG